MQTLTRHNGSTYRVSSSALTGWAAIGTPLCPAALVASYNLRATACAVNATGVDRVDVTTGQGDFSGTIDVVVEGTIPSMAPNVLL